MLPSQSAMGRRSKLHLARLRRLSIQPCGTSKGDQNMGRNLIGFTLLRTVIAATAPYTERARAAPANRFPSSTLATGTFGNIGMVCRDHRFKNIWLSIQKRKGNSDMYGQKDRVEPVGDSGWHRQPGHSLIIVAPSILREYRRDHLDCKPKVHTQGIRFVDAVRDDSHIIRNEGSVRQVPWRFRLSRQASLDG